MFQPDALVVFRAKALKMTPEDDCKKKSSSGLKHFSPKDDQNIWSKRWRKLFSFKLVFRESLFLLYSF